MKGIRRAPPLTLALLALVLVAGGLGTVYAGWTSKVTISGSASSAVYSVIWRAPTSSTSSCGSPGQITLIRQPADFRLMTLTISNAAPGQSWTCNLVVDNQSTITVYLNSVEIADISGLTGCHYDLSYSGNRGKKLYVCDQMEFEYVGFPGSLGPLPIGAGDEQPQTMNIRMTNGALPQQTYTFTAFTNVGQFAIP